MSAWEIRPATCEDAGALIDIYNHFVTETVVSFEDEPIDAAEMRRRIEASLSVPLPWLVAQGPAGIVGYAYAVPWRARRSYRFSTEVTVYVAPNHGGLGIGSMLYGQLIAALRALGMRCAMGGIALPNPASIALHEKLGFRKVAHFERVGFKLGRWVDVGYWQLLL